jgi:hypothetical protein
MERTLGNVLKTFLNEKIRKETKNNLPFVSKSPFRLQEVFLQKEKMKRTLGNVLNRKLTKGNKKNLTFRLRESISSPGGVPTRRKDEKNVRKRS